MKTAPRLIAYYNNDTVRLATAKDLPHTHLILAFIVPDAAGNMVTADVEPMLGKDVQELQSLGKKVLVSIGGACVNSSNYLAMKQRLSKATQEVAAFVAEQKLDGVDIEYEDGPALQT